MKEGVIKVRIMNIVDLIQYRDKIKLRWIVAVRNHFKCKQQPLRKHIITDYVLRRKNVRDRLLKNASKFYSITNNNFTTFKVLLQKRKHYFSNDYKGKLKKGNLRHKGPNHQINSNKSKRVQLRIQIDSSKA